MIHTKEELYDAIQYYGFLPLFKNEIPNFSVEELCDPSVWFQKDQDGPWEWKGEVIQDRNSVYGKFFNNKAGFISKKWFKHFLNYRRDGYDLDARYDDGLAPYQDLELFEMINQYQPITTKQLKVKFDYKESTLTRLQMQTYIIIEDFEYNYSKDGKRYGWGISSYATVERILGKYYVTKAYQVDPMKSKEKIEKHMRKLFPGITDHQLKQFLK